MHSPFSESTPTDGVLGISVCISCVCVLPKAARSMVTPENMAGLLSAPSDTASSGQAHQNGPAAVVEAVPKAKNTGRGKGKSQPKQDVCFGSALFICFMTNLMLWTHLHN